MLAIKFKRVGKKHQTSFRLIIAEKRSKTGGRFVEDVGWYNPHTKKAEIKKERVDYWLKVGAQPTASVYNLLIKNGVIKGKKISVHKKAKASEESLKESLKGGEPTNQERSKEGQSAAGGEEKKEEAP